MERVVYDLAQLPRVADGWTFLYTEKVRIERVDYAIELRDREKRVPVPVAALSALILGPGATITHAAVLALAESGCSIVWSGEGLARFYAAGLGETRRSHHLEAQARAWALPSEHMAVVRRMYTLRFSDELPAELTLEQIRGREGVRVRQAYAELSRETGVSWSGRDYRRNNWNAATPINRALSAANACLYGFCHAAIVATGFSPGLGFIHTGKSLSFVYDIADLYKVDVTIPAAFRAVAENASSGLEGRVRRSCRDLFLKSRLMDRIVPDTQRVLGLTPEPARLVQHRGSMDGESEAGMGDEPGALWNPDGSRTAGGRNFAEGIETLPSLAKAQRQESYEQGDAYEDDIELPLAVGDDDEVPF